MDHKARKRFGQNFLQDEGIIRHIIHSIHPQQGQRLVEIGPGLGALTQELLAEAGVLDVIELDRDVIPHLQRACTGKGELRIHNADALDFDLRTLADAQHKLRIIGNLPYNISTPLLFHFIDQIDVIEDMHFMLQKEVVDRLAAPPGGKDYGRLSVMVQYHCAVEKILDVPPEAFTPAPKVDSAVVRLIPHRTPPVQVASVAELAKLVTSAFAHRRKTLRNNLKGILSAEQIEALGIDPGARAETLSLEEFARLSNAVKKLL
ncbi:MAG: 16S rRNA (adenine(1518)-N(6)/adenine(1519)-N(6))-dimethyltransferase RsmA [Pseudomonadota bacterium]